MHMWSVRASDRMDEYPITYAEGITELLPAFALLNLLLFMLEYSDALYLGTCTFAANSSVESSGKLTMFYPTPIGGRLY
jgi:hypothetical protein